ncbi:DOMON-like domain-containing protein [Brevundimonas sp.]|uniref:DOMON-like domain-containing protein n=1 Tax=Brevundimonas sp. TaxID=1871086 RepID=UPI00286BA3E6|nr:DOMON-like domain-containing protein [Brevundimonas sp.]
MTRQTLTAFGQGRGVVSAITADVISTPSGLHVSFRVDGDLHRVNVPDPASPQRTDGLWRTTCLEVFVHAGEGYYEFNLSPSGQWAAYRFGSYRQGMAEADIGAPTLSTERDDRGFRLTARMELPHDADGRLALSAVIEQTDGAKTYWALAHPSDKPDFHHPDSFVLDLP